MGRGRAITVVVLACLTASGCGSDGPDARPSDRATATSSPTSPTTAATPSTPAPAPRPGTVPPPWLGTRVLPEDARGFGEVRPTPTPLRRRAFTLPDRLPALPGHGFAARVSPVPRSVLARSTWQPACPVGVDDLRWVRLTFRGFDGRRHTGELLVNAAVAEDLVGVFRSLWRARFPLEELRITRRDELDAPPTGDGNGTGAFVCRPITGGTSYSEHAYGTAIDLNPFQNPYVKGDLVLPELASSYVDRARVRPGMILAGDAVTRAFARIGWDWGGAWSTLVDTQHFSRSGH